jgi:hypothetical protein
MLQELAALLTRFRIATNDICTVFRKVVCIFNGITIAITRTNTNTIVINFGSWIASMHSND